MTEEKPEAPVQEEKTKVDVTKLLSIIPSATELKSEKKQLVEKRIRVKYDRTLTRPIAKIPLHVANELGIKTGDNVEIVVAGKKKVQFTAEVVESKDNVIVVYPAELEKQGVADNSIATIRKAR
ncbi:MAG: hypothetical protein QXJ69_04175 [Desulfurococcaceae archaeon]